MRVLDQYERNGIFLMILGFLIIVVSLNLILYLYSLAGAFIFKDRAAGEILRIIMWLLLIVGFIIFVGGSGTFLREPSKSSDTEKEDESQEDLPILDEKNEDLPVLGKSE